MINRAQLETVLKVNGVSPTAPDEEIRSVLVSARYDNDEVDSALMVLRQNINTKETRVDGLHKIFRTDEALRPAEIAKLLCIEVEHTEVVSVDSKGRDLSYKQEILLGLFSLMVAVAGVLFYMYQNQSGIFHPSSEVALFR